MSAVTSQKAVEAFLIEEANLLDEHRFDDWLALFADDGYYWIPAFRDQIDRHGAASIIHEDRSVLRMRIRRLGHPRAWSLKPLPRTSHLLGNISVSTEKDGAIEATASLQVAMYRDGDRLRYDGRQTTRLISSGKSFKIALKRIDLIDCDGVHAVMPLPI